MLWSLAQGTLEGTVWAPGAAGHTDCHVVGVQRGSVEQRDEAKVQGWAGGRRW